MKAILMSIKPKWCEKIFSGEKTIEVRKTTPKLETPFKAYIYQTKKPVEVWLNGTGRHISEYDKTCWYNDGSGKVIGEFICDKVDKFSCKCIPRQGIAFGYERFIKDGVYLLNNNDTDYVVFERQDKYLDTMLKNADLAAMCLTPRELFQYAGGFSKPLYTWHISDLKIYDKPRELGEFSRYGYKDIEHAGSGCVFCGNTQCLHSNPEEIIAGHYIPPICKISGCTLKRAPQSWQYVEEF